ncbi:MAG: undecaprenyldiphospho-muramoylpentapeptide beta-N-acetylglucosaminyltransferase [Firmicutes bacterium]|nr:undecaprenyldiphospho-muramoylpentapeptide beta-N-acetylglucosaminyltransferase [Bacillota bacterium]
MRVIYAGGGTGGHINPAISVADYARRRNDKNAALFIGTMSGLETKLVPKAGYDIRYIEVTGFDRKHITKNFSTLKKLFKAVGDCKKIIKEFKPDCIVCTGGYVSGPVMMAAKKAGVPALIHEQNVYPGLTVRGSEKYAEYLALSFDETVNHMKNKEKCVVTGNPVRGAILSADRKSARKKLGIKKPFVLIFGGSLGADRINETVVDMLARVVKDGKFTLLFGTGDRNYEKVMRMVAEKGIALNENVNIVPYIDNMADVMAAADVVASRSGAITVSELAALKKPAILIPSPNVVRNHQEQNARELEKGGAAAVIVESELTADVLYDKIFEIISDKKITAEMSENMAAFAKTDALEKIYALMEKMSEKAKEGKR